MKIIKHPTKFTPETLVPGMFLTGKHPSEIGMKFEFLGISTDDRFPLRLRHDNSIVHNHMVYDSYGKSYWEEIEDLHEDI